MMKTFSFRAECMVDVDGFRAQCEAAGIDVHCDIRSERGPDVQVELQSEASIESIRSAARNVVDGHVIVQTLRECALAQNSLERNYG